MHPMHLRKNHLLFSNIPNNQYNHLLAFSMHLMHPYIVPFSTLAFFHLFNKLNYFYLFFRNTNFIIAFYRLEKLNLILGKY